MNLRKLVKELSEAAGPSGFEKEAALVTVNTWRPYVDEIEVDRLGSVFARLEGSGPKPRPRILIAAHLDEIGLMVKEIISNKGSTFSQGFIKVVKIGGIDIRQLYGQTVLVHGSVGQEEKLIGVIGSLPDKMRPASKRNRLYDYDDLVVDVGLSYDGLIDAVRVGDFITFQQPLRSLFNKRITGKALDNRVSIAALAYCLAELKNRQFSWDVTVLASAQEETSFLGAATTAFSLKPDIALAVDATVAKGPGVAQPLTYELDSGPTIGFGPNIHELIHDKLHETAKEMKIKCQLEPYTRHSGTDAYALQIAAGGIPTGVVSIPLRNMHSSVEIAALKDIKRAGLLLSEFICALNDEFIERLKSYNRPDLSSQNEKSIGDEPTPPQSQAGTA